jgi:hypothetical protein
MYVSPKKIYSDIFLIFLKISGRVAPAIFPFIQTRVHMHRTESASKE